MTSVYTFHDVGRLPAPGDNVAIATRMLPAGTRIALEDAVVPLEYTILEGHRFAVHSIAPGAPLLSWGLPFGYAQRCIAAGTYVCNARILEALRGRQEVNFPLPLEANFADRIEPYELDERRFRPGVQAPLYPEPRTFLGYERPAGRGVGTRNYIVILGTSSRTASFVRALEERLCGQAAAYPQIDGIVAVAHTEGGGSSTPNNLELVLRTLSGFLTHPNIGAILAVDDGTEAVTNALLRQYMLSHHESPDDVLHHFMTLQGKFQSDLERGAAIIQGWLPHINAVVRRPYPLTHLKVALQCGGSDAFSGVSGNPLAAWVAKDIVQHGGAANLAETDELIGAEAYVLQNVRDLATARTFLATVERFKERVAWHGHTAEGNPSGGNMFRGLYNIVLKSLGAAMKRHPEVRLDYVIDYGARMLQPGYYFMDSPGNDLESIAGQVASGCNMIFFITGNGSITNFPFVPTIKIITTTRRYELLSRDMDINAGAYQDGIPMDVLGQQMFDLTIAVASGQRSLGEQAGHAQVSLWRDWQQSDDHHLRHLQQAPAPLGKALAVQAGPTLPPLTFSAMRTATGYATDQVGLLLPTSLCSSQIARLIAERLNERLAGPTQPVSRFLALPHTEGCGVSGGSSETMYARTMLGYLTHPLVRFGLFLEHGCEKTHNDYMAHQLEHLGIDRQRFGWASVQLDGGIERVTEKVEAWFEQTLAAAPATQYVACGFETLRLGLLADGEVPEAVAQSLAQLTRTVVHAGGSVVIPETSALLAAATYRAQAIAASGIAPSLAYGQAALTAGLHVMETPTEHWVETLTGLGATGVEIILAYIARQPRQTHPLVPVLQVTANTTITGDVDLYLDGDPALWAAQLARCVLEVAARTYRPQLFVQGNSDFQVSRGLLGISL